MFLFVCCVCVETQLVSLNKIKNSLRKFTTAENHECNKSLKKYHTVVLMGNPPAKNYGGGI